MPEGWDSFHPDRRMDFADNLTSTSLTLEKMIQVARHQSTALLFALLPTLLRNKIRPLDKPSRPPSKTAYLDGIRGYASVGVAILHMVMVFFPESNFAYNGSPGRNYFFQLPFVRLLYTGQPTIFFLISGYVLSLGIIRKTRNQNYAGLQTDLSSKIFRRGLRLYIPSIIATFIPMFMVQCGLFFPVVQFGNDMPHKTMDMPPAQPNLMAGFWHWCKTIPPLLWPFD